MNLRIASSGSLKPLTSDGQDLFLFKILANVFKVCVFLFAAGVFCAVVSHPADTIVSKLNQDKTATVGSVARNLGWGGKWTCIYSESRIKIVWFWRCESILESPNHQV